METLEQLCRTHTTLSASEIQRLAQLRDCLSLVADLTNADVFLDCPVDASRAVVVAHASPSQGVSLYQNQVVGKYAYQRDEPAVFHAAHMGIPVCDLKAVTQERRTVRQNAAPVVNEAGQVIAVVIRERDVSQDLLYRKKFEELARDRERAAPLSEPGEGRELDALALREMHHRVKNSLQLVASILNLQARKAQDPALQTILKENVARVLSIAGIHDILLHKSGTMQTVRSDELLGRLQGNLQALVPEEQRIVLESTGDSLELSSDTAASVALVVAELVTNALRHGFAGRACGRVTVSVCGGELYHTVMVCDDGVGFDPAQAAEDSLGLRIVEAIVRDKLGGTLRILSDSHGTKASFDFRHE